MSTTDASANSKHMKTINSVSGGQTSAYMMKHYPADYNLFALVELEDPACAPKDPWIKKYFESKTGREFIATAEEDAIAYTLHDMEQFTGQEITFVQNKTFDQLLRDHNLLPSPIRRFCTQDMKVRPIAKWVVDSIGEPVEMRIGFRGGEDKRVDRARAAHNQCGFRTEKFIIGKHPSGKNKWFEFDYAVNAFPLFDAGIFKDTIVEYWRDKPVRFAERNNCIGCFHRNPILLKLMSQKHPEKYDWFVRQEETATTKQAKNGNIMSWNMWRADGIKYEKIRKHRTQLTMADTEGFLECDSGYCGL